MFLYIYSSNNVKNRDNSNYKSIYKPPYVHCHMSQLLKFNVKLKKTNSIDVTCDVREKKRNYMIYRSPLSDLPSRAALHVATLSKDSLLNGAIGIGDDTAVEVDAVSLSGLNSSTTRQRTLMTKKKQKKTRYHVIEY